ncbi:MULTISPECIES: hypothetical protein [Capnocytophaga]
MKKEKRIDIEEVACAVLGLEYEDYEEADDCTEQIENILIDEMNIDLETLERIVSKLLPLIEIGKSPLTGIAYKGFSREFIKGSCKVRKWIAKMQIDE